MNDDTQSGQFDEDFSYIGALLSRVIDDAEELEAVLNQIYSAIFQINFSKYDLDHVRRAAPKYLRRIFELRIKLRDRIPDWRRQGFITGNAETAIRGVFRVSRYASDMLGELISGHARLPDDDTQALRAFSGDPINTLINPKFGDQGGITFRSGDVLLVRGTRHNSAAIARIGDNDSQFSHVAMVYEDAQGKKWVVEALIEEGAIVNSLDDALDHGIARAVLFRHRDAALAEKAAAEIFAIVNKAGSDKKFHIAYDFSMTLENHDELFCSEVVHLAYAKASAGKYMMPSFPTNLDMKNRDFLKRIGVTTKKTFAPGDMELETDFDLVAEWRDYRVTSRIRLQDMLITKLFEWMEVHDYRFKEDFPIRLIARLGRLSSYLSSRAKTVLQDVVPKVPGNMQSSTIAAVAMLHRTAEPLLERLMALEAQSIAEHGYQLHPRRVLQQLEAMREESKGKIGYLVTRRP